jgi:hypothetical protein
LDAAPESFFSPDYATARRRFRSAALARGAALDALELEASGPRGEPLATDIAWLGAPGAARLVLHSSGLHGVEGYAGTAIQLAALAALELPPPGCALVLVHALNPWGMAWLRRANEHNVDLNRNFLPHGAAWSGAPPLYAALDRMLNPASPPGFDWFPLKAAGLLARHGMRALEQAVAEGQYEFPRGLFYGGAGLEPGPRRYAEWLRRRAAGARYLCALDVHTGLGRWGQSTAIMEPGATTTPPGELERALGEPLVNPARGDAPYTIRGSMSGVLAQALPGVRADFVLQEIGTVSALRILRAMREENRWHHHGAGTPDHPAKRALLAAMAPAATPWRRRAIAHGARLLRAACAWTFSGATSAP